MPLLSVSSLSGQIMENKMNPIRRVLDRIGFPTYTAAILAVHLHKGAGGSTIACIAATMCGGVAQPVRAAES